jgi:hypothetical protein
LISFDVSVGTVRAGVGYSPPTCTHLAGTEGCTLHMSPWSCVRMRCRQNGPSQGDRLVGYLAAGRCPDYSDISSGEARAWRTWVFGSRWWWTACSVPSSGPQPPGSTYLPHIDHEMVIIDRHFSLEDMCEEKVRVMIIPVPQGDVAATAKADPLNHVKPVMHAANQPLDVEGRVETSASRHCLIFSWRRVGALFRLQASIGSICRTKSSGM